MCSAARTSSDHDQINVVTVTGWWREMNFVQQRAAAHGDLGTQEFVVEQRDHRSAEQEVLLDLILRCSAPTIRKNGCLGDTRTTLPRSLSN
jgi:hypothetical protein